MADIVSSLFGLSPREQYTRDRQREFENQAVTMSGMYDNQYDRQNAYLGSKVGNLLAQGVGNLFGLQDPALKRMSGLEGVLQEAQQELGQDMADPTKLYPTLADKLQQRGFGREAAMVSMQGQEAINQWKLNQAKLDSETAQAGRFRAEAASKEQETKQDIDAQKALATFVQQNGRQPTQDETIQIIGQYMPVSKYTDFMAKIGNTGVPSTDKLAAQALQILDDPNAPPALKTRATETLNRVQQLKNVPPGFERMPDGSVRAIVGGPQDIAQIDKKRKQVTTITSRLGDLQAFENSLDTALKLASPKTTGLVGKGLAMIPGEPAYDLASSLESITAGLAFDKLQDMRNNSPTGGALGNVSNQELTSLKTAIANLKQSQSYEQFVKNLKDVKTRYANIKAAAESDLATLQQTESTGNPGVSGNFNVGKVYTDAKGNKAIYQADGTWKEVK
jgi:hypothetical protein